jgi:CDP-2,3-bis-(O-geranylgeranyl)-sn-glycerol synthase
VTSFIQIFTVLVLIGAANTAPIVAKNLLGARLAWPLDGGLKFLDGLPLFGKSKTLRGVVAGIFTPAVMAPLLGHRPWHGVVIGALAMVGDLLSSFTKRRLRLTPSSQATGLDQIPEALLPALAAHLWFGFAWWQVPTIVIAFFVLEIVLSKLLFRLKLRDRPY